MIANKEVMSQNIRRLLESKNVKAIDVCRALGIKQNTFSDWMTGKTYPRIDKIEMLANYFGVNKSDLVEEKRPSVEFTINDEEKIIIDLYRHDAGFRQLLRLSRYANYIRELNDENRKDNK